MATHWSPTEGFLHTDFHDAIPDDAITITLDEHTTLMNELSSGHREVYDNNGIPATREVTHVLTAEEMDGLILEALRASDYRMLSDELPVDKTDWVNYRAALRALSSNPSYPNVTLPTEPS